MSYYVCCKTLYILINSVLMFKANVCYSAVPIKSVNCRVPMFSVIIARHMRPHHCNIHSNLTLCRVAKKQLATNVAV